MTEGGDDGDSSGGGYLAATPGDKNENQQVTIPDLKAEADEPQVSGDLPTTEGGGEVREVLYLNLENFDRDAMKNDQIWRETQSRIEFLKMRNITMSNSADRNSLARKLVADKEWKQLDKFTKLMEMIMYLQSGFDKRLVI